MVSDGHAVIGEMAVAAVRWLVRWGAGGVDRCRGY